MIELLKYAPIPESDNLQPTEFGHAEAFYSGQTQYAYQEEYVVTRGIKKGIMRTRDLGLIPESYQTTSDGILEVASNNMLPGLTDDEDHVQFVKFRGGTSMARQKDKSVTDILISQCIFGEFGSTYTLSDGYTAPVTSPKTVVDSPVEKINIDSRFSLYEHDAVRRQTVLLRNLATDNNHYSSVTIGVPRVSYYLHALKPYNDGYLAPDQMFGWFDAVDERYEAVVDAITQKLPGHLDRHIRAPLDDVEDLVRRAVKSGSPIKIEPLIEKLAAVDPMWAAALKDRAPTSDEQFRNDYAEAIEELRLPAHGANSRLVIKNPKEEGTFELGSRLESIADIAPVVAMYALPQVVTSPQGVGLYRIPTAPTSRDIQLISTQYA